MGQKNAGKELENRVEWLQQIYLSWKTRQYPGEVIEYEDFFDEECEMRWSDEIEM